MSSNERYLWLGTVAAVAGSAYYVGSRSPGGLTLGLATLAISLPTIDILRLKFSQSHWLNNGGDNSGPAAFFWLVSISLSYLFGISILVGKYFG